MLSFGGQQVPGFALADYPTREGAVHAAREQSAPEGSVFYSRGRWHVSRDPGVLGAPLACPECSNTAYFLGGVVAGAGGVYLALLLVGGYVASGPQRRQPRPEPEPIPHKPEPEKKKKKKK